MWEALGREFGGESGWPVVLLGDTGGGVGWGLPPLFLPCRSVGCHSRTEEAGVSCPLRWAPSS